MSKYELALVLSAKLDEETRTSVLDRAKDYIARHGGVVGETEEWGKRRLAYPINDKPEGCYVLINFKSEPALPSELERIFGITEGIMRSIVIRHEEKKPRAAKKKPEAEKTEA